MSDDDDFDPEGAEADWVSDHYIQSGAFDDEFYWKHSRERTRQYLMDHGDDLQKRVDSLLTEATVLAKEGHSSSALVMAMTCVELICRDLILRPLLRGLPLDDFADAMMDQLLGGRMSARVRTAVIPDLLESQGLRLSGDESMGRLVKDLAMTDGANLWKRLNGLLSKLWRISAMQSSMRARPLAQGMQH